MFRGLLWLWIGFTLVAHSASEEIPAANNGAWKIEGRRDTQPVSASCSSVRSALLLHTGSAAQLTFNGTSLSVIGIAWNRGADASITIDGGQERRVSSDSRDSRCARFASFTNLNPNTPHTVRISVPSNPRDRNSVFTLISVDIQSAAPSNPPDPPEDPPPPSPSPPADDPPNETTTPAPPSSTRTPTPSPTRSSTSTRSNPTSASRTGEDEDESSASGESSSTPRGSTTSPNSSEDLGPTLTADNPFPSDVPGSDVDVNNASSDEDGTTGTEKSGGGGSKASTLVPAILIPLLFIAGLVAAASWTLRKQRLRARIPPSAAFRLQNPDFFANQSHTSMAELPRPWDIEGEFDRPAGWTTFPSGASPQPR